MKNKAPKMGRMMTRIVLIFTSIIFFACSRDKTESMIMTVKGPVSPMAIGQMLAHEHVMVDWIGADSTGSHRWNRDSVVNRVLPYLLEIKKLGVSGFVDCSPKFLGRDPLLLRELSEQSGVNIITNTGLYGAVDNRFLPSYAFEEDARLLAERWINEFQNGIGDTGIKPGFVKIGVKPDSLLSPIHSKIVTAAIITHQQTGLVVKSHTGGDVPAFQQIEMFRQRGVSPSGFIWTHAQNGSLAKNIEAARLGAWVSLDGVNISGVSGEGTDGNLNLYIERLMAFKKEGLLGRVLLSHDAGWYSVGELNGGEFRAYSDIHRHLIPALYDKGFTDEEIEIIMEKNPAEAFKVQPDM